jgi:tetratricopeptide (TPR) repeat protein
VEQVQSISFSHFSAPLLMDLGNQYLLQGEHEKASRYLEEPFTIAERSGQEEQIPYLQISLAEWDLREGRPEEVLARLELLLTPPGFQTTSDHRAMQVAAEAYLQRGADAQAEPLVREGLEEATRQGSAIALPGWFHLEGMLALRRRSWEEAEQALDRAVSLARTMPYPYQEARALYTYGMLAEHQEELEQTQQRLVSSLELFRQLGAAPDAARVEQSLTRVRHGLGSRVSAGDVPAFHGERE